MTVIQCVACFLLLAVVVSHVQSSAIPSLVVDGRPVAARRAIDKKSHVQKSIDKKSLGDQYGVQNHGRGLLLNAQRAQAEELYEQKLAARMNDQPEDLRNLQDRDYFDSIGIGK